MLDRVGFILSAVGLGFSVGRVWFCCLLLVCVGVYVSVFIFILFYFSFFARAVVKVLNGAGARLYFSSPGIKLKPVRKKVHSENKK